MNTRQKLHQLHLNEWASRFADQKATLTINDISIIQVGSDIPKDFLRLLVKAVRYA